MRARVFESFDVLVDRFIGTSLGKGELRVIWLRGAAVGAFIHHQVTAVRLDGELKTFDGLEHEREVFRLFVAAQPDAKFAKPVGNFSRDALNVLPLGCVLAR